MNKIHFKTNWNNKLDCTCFTSLRLSGSFEVGQIVEVFCNGNIKGAATVIDKKRLESIESINDWVAYLDTGYNAIQCRDIIRKMYPKIQEWRHQPIYYYLFKYMKKG